MEVFPKLGARGTVEDISFLTELSKGGNSWARRQSMRPASTPLKVNEIDLDMLGWAFSWTSPLIIGAKAHSSSAAVEVVSGICPVGIRKRDLCCREYIRIVSSGESHSLLISTVT